MAREGLSGRQDGAVLIGGRRIALATAAFELRPLLASISLDGGIFRQDVIECDRPSLPAHELCFAGGSESLLRDQAASSEEMIVHESRESLGFEAEQAQYGEHEGERSDPHLSNARGHRSAVVILSPLPLGVIDQDLKSVRAFALVDDRGETLDEQSGLTGDEKRIGSELGEALCENGFRALDIRALEPMARIARIVARSRVAIQLGSSKANIEDRSNVRSIMSRRLDWNQRVQPDEKNIGEMKCANWRDEMRQLARSPNGATGRMSDLASLPRPDKRAESEEVRPPE